MNAIKSLLVVWKNKKNELYYHIGTLSYDGEFYTFEYTYRSHSPRNVKEAQQQGYNLHPAFPQLEKTYKSTTLFPAFNRRIPGESRMDYPNILNEFSLSFDADRMDILRVTRGTLAGDSYSFEEPLRLNGTKLSSNFYINGMRHQKHLSSSWEKILNIGDTLVAELEEEIQFDQYAVKIKTDKGVQLGYIPGIYAQAVHSLLKQDITVNLVIKELRPNFSPQWWVKVELTATIEMKQVDKRYIYNFDSFIFQETA